MVFWFLADIYKFGSCQEEDVYGVDWMYGRNTIRASNVSASALGGTGEVRAVFLFCMVHGCTPAITSSPQHRCIGMNIDMNIDMNIGMNIGMNIDMNRHVSLEPSRLEEQLDV